jgi:hypothetical protein
MSLTPVHALLDPKSSYRLPEEFTLFDYMQTEREFWALFPETQGKRVNFCQVGLTAQLYIDVDDHGGSLSSNEAYFLMPCSDHNMRPVRMQAVRHLTVSEYRMSRLTALKLGVYLRTAGDILEQVHQEVLGAEILGEERDAD